MAKRRRRKKRIACKLVDRCAIALTVLLLAAVAVIVVARRHDLYAVAGGIAAGLAVRAMFALVVRSCNCGRGVGSARS